MGRPLDRWTGQDSGTSLVGEGGMSNGCPMDVHRTGRTILSGQRILMANLDMSGVVIFGTPGTTHLSYSLVVSPNVYAVFPPRLSVRIYLSSDDC